MATILDLLMALNRGDLPPLPPPATSMPLGPISPLPGSFAPTMQPESEPPPPQAPIMSAPPIDMAAIEAAIGPRPTAPAPRGTLERIANALSGFSAGVQGYGPQFLAQLREPQRQYEAQTERYGARRTAAIADAEDRRERQRIEKQRRADIQADREFDQWATRAKLTHDDAREAGRQAFELQKVREQERIADERQEKQLRAGLEKQRLEIEHELTSKDGAPPSIAKEISEYRVGLRPALSPGAEKWRGNQAKILQARLARLNRPVGGGGDGRLMAVLENGQTVPASLVDKESGTVRLGGQAVKVTGYTGGGATPGKPAPPAPLFGLPPGIGALTPEQLAQPAPSGKTATMEQVRASAKEAGISVTEATKQFRDAGYAIQK